MPEGGSLFLQYRRWLGVEDGFYDEARILIDDEMVWTNHATSQDLGSEHHIDMQWALHTVEIADTDGDGQVTVSWDILSDQGLAFGGWNIDDVCVYSYGGGSDTDGGVDLDPNDETPVGVAPACGCSSTTPIPATGGLAVLLLGLAAMRRRA